jgi:cell division protein FtsW
MKKYLAKMDLWLLTLTIIYAILGLIMIYSASSVVTVLSQKVASTYYFFRQGLIVLAGLLISFLVIRIPTSKYKYFSFVYILAILFSLGGLYVYGKAIKGAQGWYDLGFFNLQPAEFAKSAIIVYMATFYNHLIKIKEHNFIKYLIPFGLGIIITLLVLMQPDMGSAVIIAGITLLLFLSLPLNKFVRAKCNKIIGGLIVIFAIFGMLVGPKLISNYQMSRLKYQNPCTRYTESTGYQVCNGFIAIKNGGLFGLGFGNSTQKYLYLPEAYTDFIFPIICEELGLIMGIIIILGYAFMLWRILIIAKSANNVRNSTLAYGTFIYLSLHLIINLLGVLALIPLTGVPLPLLSYGGSFNINVIILLFMCQRVSIESKESKIKEEISKL